MNSCQYWWHWVESMDTWVLDTLIFDWWNKIMILGVYVYNCTPKRECTSAFINTVFYLIFSPSCCEEVGNTMPNCENMTIENCEFLDTHFSLAMHIYLYTFHSSCIFGFCILLICIVSCNWASKFCSDWNPHADLQAMARAHRLGQTNKVMLIVDHPMASFHSLPYL